MLKENQSAVSDAQQQLAEFNQTVFTDLQHDFHELNHEIPKDSPLESFRHEYAKLFGILQKSMTNQARYIEKCRVLESEIVGNKAKVRTVSKLSEEDSRSISNLNDERDKKQASLAENQARLKEAMEENEMISSEITGYEAELERCVADERGQKDFIKQLKNRRQELMKEHDDLGNQIPQLEQANKEAKEKMEGKDHEIAESLAELKHTEEMIEAKHKEGQMEQQRLFDLERDREQTRQRLKETQQKVKDRQADVSQQQDAVRQLERKVREQKRRFETAKSEKQETQERCQKFQKELDTLNQTIVGIDSEITESKSTLEERQRVAEGLQKQAATLEKEREKVQADQASLQEEFESLRKESDTARNKVDEAETRIETLRREGDLKRKMVDSCVREENTKLKKKENEAQKHTAAQALLELYKNQIHNTECEISIIKTHLQDTQKKIFGIETDREHYSEELSNATSQYLHAQDVLKDIEQKVDAKNKEIIEADKKVHQQQALYEQVRSEREITSKKVKAVEAEITTLESNFSRMKFAIEQHKEDIRRKDKERIVDRRNLQNVNEEDGRLREKLTEVQIDATTAQRAITAHEGELSKMDQTIRDAERRLKLDEQQLDQAKKERDHRSNESVKRDMEIRELDQKLEVLKNQCKRGERDYDEKENEIERIKLQLQQDSERLKELSKVDDQLKIKREKIHSMEKELMQLKAERAAMEDELTIPINIHRWTLLESSDPERFDQLKRYQELQAELVAKTKEDTELQEKIKQREADYQELSTQLKRKPGVEDEQQVNEYQAFVKSEKFKLEDITAKLEMYRDTVKEYRKELADVQAELVNDRNKWIKEKKREIKHRQKLQELQQQEAELEKMGFGQNLLTTPDDI